MTTTHNHDADANANVSGAPFPTSFWDVAASDPERVAIVDVDDQELTFGEVRRLADNLSAELLELRMRRGETIALMARNVPEYLIAALAGEQVGVYLTPINWHLTDDEALYIVGDSEAKVLIIDPEHAALAVRSGLTLEHIITTQPSPGHRDIRSLPDRELDPSARSAGTRLLYTSGTTGSPKGVRKALPSGSPEEHGRQTAAGLAQNRKWPAGPGAHIVVAPLYHAAPVGYTLAALHFGQTAVLMQKWDANTFLSRVQRHRVTSSHMVPTMFQRLLGLPEDVRTSYDVSSLNYVVHAAAPCPVDVKRAMIAWLGPVVFEYYSTTEGGGTFVEPNEWLEHPGTVGRPWPGAHIKILDEDGAEVPAGTIGVIYMLGSESFEYHRDSKKTEDARRGAYFTAGDLGHIDEEGYLFISDRRSDLIISGGVNIYPAEVEAVLAAHPAVDDVGVVGVPDKEWGASVLAAVQLNPSYQATNALATELIEFSKKSLASFKCPRAIEFRDVPRSPVGKIIRKQLKDESAVGAPAEVAR